VRLRLVASLAAFADLTGSWQLHLDPDFGGEDDTTSARSRKMVAS